MQKWVGSILETPWLRFCHRMMIPKRELRKRQWEKNCESGKRWKEDKGCSEKNDGHRSKQFIETLKAWSMGEKVYFIPTSKIRKMHFPRFSEIQSIDYQRSSSSVARNSSLINDCCPTFWASESSLHMFLVLNSQRSADYLLSAYDLHLFACLPRSSFKCSIFLLVTSQVFAHNYLTLQTSLKSAAEDLSLIACLLWSGLLDWLVVLELRSPCLLSHHSLLGFESWIQKESVFRILISLMSSVFQLELRSCSRT